MASRLVPALGWLRSYDRSWLGPDIVAGATAAAVVIPQAMGYATVAGLPPEIGLYTCIFPMLVYALLGGSVRLSFSTTSTIVALTGLALTTVGATGSTDEAVSAVGTLTLLVGLSMLVFRFLRLGWMLEAISDAVIAGLKVGVGLTIMADQLPKLLGVSAAEGGFFDDLRNVVDQLPDVNVPTALVGGITVAALLVLKWRWPRIPGPLIALGVGIGLAAFTGIVASGVETIPAIPTGFPVPALPSMDHFEALIPFALAIALMAYFETIAAARMTRKADDPPIDNNHEYIANGLAAIVGSIFRTVPPAGGFSQTQVNTNAGAKTQLSEMVTVVLAVAVALFLAPVLSDLPEATLGAIVVVAVLGLISPKELRRIGAIHPAELWIAGLTAFISLYYDLLVGVLAGVVLTLYFVLRALNHPTLVELRRPPDGGELVPARDGDDPVPGMLVLRVQGGLYTMNVRGIQARIVETATSADPRPEVVLLDVQGLTDLSVTVLDVLAETDHMLQRRGSRLWLAALTTRAEGRVRRSEMWDTWTENHQIHPTVTSAVEEFEAEGAGS